MDTARTLLAVPNVSEGRDAVSVAAIAQAFANGAHGLAENAPAPARANGAPRQERGDGGPVRLLDVHSDADHHRSVFTLAGPAGALTDALLAGVAEAVRDIDVLARASGAEAEVGQHPHVGAVDVAPVVYLDPAARGLACAQALVLAERIGEELAIPVFLYGELTEDGDGRGRSRAQLRRGGVLGLAERMAATPHPLRPDFGPARMHPSAGATLVAARPPLVAFNLQLAPPATLADAQRIAGLVREGGAYGLPGLRAIGVLLGGDVAQVSMNVERPFELALASVVGAVRAHAEVESAELVGLAPAASLDGFPSDLPIPGFDPARQLIENALGC
jgi:glutamate formiminotransferase / 5-formyltetrahydrofolate cyclo-ligase